MPRPFASKVDKLEPPAPPAPAPEPEPEPAPEAPKLTAEDIDANYRRAMYEARVALAAAQQAYADALELASGQRSAALTLLHGDSANPK